MPSVSGLLEGAKKTRKYGVSIGQDCSGGNSRITPGRPEGRRKKEEKGRMMMMTMMMNQSDQVRRYRYQHGIPSTFTALHRRGLDVMRPKLSSFPFRILSPSDMLRFNLYRKPARRHFIWHRQTHSGQAVMAEIISLGFSVGTLALRSLQAGVVRSKHSVDRRSYQQILRDIRRYHQPR